MFFLNLFDNISDRLKFLLEKIETVEEVSLFELVIVLNHWFRKRLWNLLNKIIFQSFFEKIDLIQEIVIHLFVKATIIFFIYLGLIFDFLSSFGELQS